MEMIQNLTLLIEETAHIMSIIIKLYIQYSIISLKIRLFLCCIHSFGKAKLSFKSYYVKQTAIQYEVYLIQQQL